MLKLQDTNISYPLIRTCTSAYQKVIHFVFRKIWRVLFPCNQCFEICPFALLPTNLDFKKDITIALLHLHINR